jgi:hypothetical protein
MYYLVAKVNFSVALAKIATVYFEPWGLHSFVTDIMILFLLIHSIANVHRSVQKVMVKEGKDDSTNLIESACISQTVH